MDGRTDGWVMHGWMHDQMNGWMDADYVSVGRWMSGCMATLIKRWLTGHGDKHL